MAAYLGPAMLGLQGLGTFMKYSSAKQEGKYAMGSAMFDASQHILQGAQARLNAEQLMNDRIMKFDSETESNIATFAFLGRDVDDGSRQAFLDKQKEIAYKDTSRMDNDGYIKLGQAKLRAKQAMFEGTAKRQAANNRATSALISGAFGMAQTGFNVYG